MLALYISTYCTVIISLGSFISGLALAASAMAASEPSLDDDAAAVSYFPQVGGMVLHYWMGGRVPRGLMLPLLRSIVRRRSYCSSGSPESSLIVFVCAYHDDSRGRKRVRSEG